MAQSERNSHSINRGVGKNQNVTQVLVPRKHVSRVGSYSLIGGHSVTRTELRYENVHKAQTARKFDSKHKTIRTTLKVSPWNDQLYNITGGGGLKPVLQAPYLTLIFCSDSQHLVSCSVLVVNIKLVNESSRTKGERKNHDNHSVESKRRTQQIL